MAKQTDFAGKRHTLTLEDQRKAESVQVKCAET